MHVVGASPDGDWVVDETLPLANPDQQALIARLVTKKKPTAGTDHCCCYESNLVGIEPSHWAGVCTRVHKESLIHDLSSGSDGGVR